MLRYFSGYKCHRNHKQGTSFVRALGLFCIWRKDSSVKSATSILLFRYEADSIFKPIVSPKYIIIKGKTWHSKYAEF